MRIERIRRGKDQGLGKFVIVRLRTWDEHHQRENWTETLFPVDQTELTLHPQHPTGFDPISGVRNACISLSSSFYRELCKYAGFRWAKESQV